MKDTMWQEQDVLGRTALELHRLGWARGTSGNISLRSSTGMDAAPIGSFPLAPSVHYEDASEGMLFWMSRTGCSMEQMSRDVLGNAGLYRVSNGSLTLLLGSGPPSTEVAAHLLALSSGGCSAMVHCHWDDMADVSRKAIGGPLPEGMALTPRYPPGSVELAMATSRLAKGHRVIIWPYHGMVALGGDLEECLGSLMWAREHFDRSSSGHGTSVLVRVPSEHL